MNDHNDHHGINPVETAIATAPKKDGALSVDLVIHRLESIHELMKRAMKPNLDYGQIPGTGSKPTLLKPGAEKLCLMFRFAPKYQTTKTFLDKMACEHCGKPLTDFGGHLLIESTCQIYDMNECFLGEASAICSTMEDKYRWRWVSEVEAKRLGADLQTCETRDGKVSEFKFAIEKAETTGKYGKPPEYWQRFRDAITSGTARFVKRKTKKGAEMDAYEIGAVLYRVPNDNLADLHNTVLRIGEKRAYLAAVRLVTGCSSIFDEPRTDDEDAEHDDRPKEPPQADPNWGPKPENKTFADEKPVYDPFEGEKWELDLNRCETTESFISLFMATPPVYQKIFAVPMFRKAVLACENETELLAIWNAALKFEGLRTAIEPQKDMKKAELAGKAAAQEMAIV